MYLTHFNLVQKAGGSQFSIKGTIQMKLAMIGLGKMGGNMAARLLRNKIEVVGFDFNTDVVNEIATKEGLIPATSVQDAMNKLTGQKIIWMMLPAGDITENQIKDLIPMLSKGDIIVDGGNSNYKDSQRRGAWLAEHGIGFMDSGTSGGIWGLENGYCLMVGATKEVAGVMTPILKALAPAADRGWAHVGPVGSGHFTKMIHNGIEYGMMQAMAEGLDLIKGKEEFNLDLAEITELWRHGSVVRSWLLDLTADALKNDQALTTIAPYVADSGEGRWTVIEAVEQGVAAPVLTSALQARFRSQDASGFSFKLLSMMRNGFGGHAIKKH
jgi:6-phosphogluconate dehydrogenase